MHPQLICYPLPSALWDGKENPPLSRNNVSTSKWIFWSRESGSFFLLQRVSCEGCGLTPLYILQVPLAGPHTTSEAQAFFHMYHSYSEITNPSDRMRWCRYSLGLLQKDVAAMVGMEEWLYRDLESGAFHRSFTPELADKLAALYGIPVEDILDDYTLFPHRGGGSLPPQIPGGKRLEPSAACRPCQGRQDKYSLLGDRTENHQPKVFPASGRKSWARFSIYASHVRYGNFSPVKRKSSSASHDMWQRRRAFVMESFCFNYSDIRSDLHDVP